MLEVSMNVRRHRTEKAIAVISIIFAVFLSLFLLRQYAEDIAVSTSTSMLFGAFIGLFLRATVYLVLKK